MVRKSDMQPRLSVIITTHRRALLLGRAIQSVRQQAGDEVQIIVVSDVADAQAHQVASARLSRADLFIERRGTPGPAASRNLGIEVATGRHVMFLDDDDSWVPGFLEALWPELERLEGAVGYVDAYLAQERRHEDRVDVTSLQLLDFGPVSHDILAVKNRIPNNCLVFERDLLRRCPFDPTLVLLEDWDHLLGALAQAPLRHLPVRGPVIHHNDPTLARTRNNSNQEHLVQTILTIYRKWPAPSEQARAARQTHFRDAGLELPLDTF